MDVIWLSRVQFALTIMFHYLFPPLTIGLGAMLVILEGAWLKTGDAGYKSAAQFWTKIFALNFAMGVVTGIVMEFQFGTNWATYSRYVGDVFGSALAAEGIFAFFLESGFLAVLVFGWDRVSPRMHFFSALMVALGSIFSSIWIVVANSWQQTPAGFHLVEQTIGGRTQIRAEITDFWAVVFNPSTVERLVHVWIGAFILGAFFVTSITAYYILRKRHETFARRSFAAALGVTLVASLAALVSGHSQARNVYHTQPAKMAAFEGHFQTARGVPLYLFGFPDEQTQQVRAGLKIPGMLSFLMHNDAKAEVTGLDRFPRDEWPPVAASFHCYHIMVALGMFFIGITVLAAVLWWRGTLFNKKWLMWVFVFAVIGPYIANELGWAAAEIGRQPWIVYGLLKTADAASPSVGAAEVLGSIVMFSLIYLILFGIWLYLLNAKIKAGPEEAAGDTADGKGFFDTAARFAGHEKGVSMTESEPGRSVDTGGRE
ncbi:MAG TPA: cytochrome ubiquinol oxidase subunit I [Phycisphaerae bacterium]|nr:cytochrome ubiquinol oxidase subunit I [Phycisphaerae bacterium]HRR84894.1 cytochrome ubiquinol oxidase subunit I [Phycisphaerae bacterium]